MSAAEQTVITAVPPPFPVTTPALLTLAIVMSELDQVTFTFVGGTAWLKAAVSFRVFFSATSLPPLITRLFFCGITPIVILILSVFFVPSAVVAVIVTEPAFFAVTSPFLSTSAMAGELLFQVTAWLASAGRTIAPN